MGALEQEAEEWLMDSEARCWADLSPEDEHYAGMEALELAALLGVPAGRALAVLRRLEVLGRATQESGRWFSAGWGGDEGAALLAMGRMHRSDHTR